MSNQASEDELEEELQAIFDGYNGLTDHEYQGTAYDRTDAINSIQSIIRTEKLKLLNELDKSMPTAEQLTTKYGYHMPEKQYGYKLALHDIREVLAKLEAEL